MDELEAALPEESPATIGTRLRAAREAAGMSREDVAARTKIAVRHLLSIEEDRFSDLAGRTYAVGFSRAYARAVGLDEGEIVDAVRSWLDMDDQAYSRVQIETFEPGDPARVPSARLAWTAALGGVLVVVVLLYRFWPSFLSPQGSLPDLLQDEGEVEAAAPASEPAGKQVSPGGAVIFTATEPRVWVKFYDAAGNQLFQKEMDVGERYRLPADAQGPLLWTARPDALEITVGGKRVAKLSDTPVTLKDVPVNAAALAARGDASAPNASTPASRQAATPPPRAVAPPRAVPTPTPPSMPSPQPSPRPSTSPNALNDAPTARPDDPAPEPEPTPPAAPATAAISGEEPALAPSTEPVSADSAPASTVSE